MSCSVSGGRGGNDIGGIGGLVVEGDITPRVQGHLKGLAAPGSVTQNILALCKEVAALIPCLDHRLGGYAIRGGAGGDAQRVADGAAAELEHHVLAQVVQQ